MIICALRLIAKNYLFCIYFCHDRHTGKQRSITGGVCHARTCIHKNDTTLCKSHGQEPEGQHEYSKEQDGIIEINLSYTSHNRL